MNFALMADKFYTHYAPMKWKDKKGAPVKNLKLRVRQWCLRQIEYAGRYQQAKTTPVATPADVDRIAQNIADSQFGDDENIIDVDLSLNLLLSCGNKSLFCMVVRLTNRLTAWYSTH